MIVFPFKTTYVNKNGKIDQNNQESISTHFMNDFYDRELYTTLELGNPAQQIKLMLTFDDCGFKVGRAKKCIYESEYLSHYNKDVSSDFKFTDLYDLPIREFDTKGCSAVDSIKLFTDLNLKTSKIYKQMDFYLANTSDYLCGVIGFKMDKYDNYCQQISAINNFKLEGITENYNWIVKYNSNSKEEGLVIFGANWNEIISNYKEENIFPVNSKNVGPQSSWSFDIDEIILYGEKNRTIYSGTESWAELDNDISFFIGNNNYKSYVEEFFDSFFAEKICSENLWHYQYNEDYYIIECNKEKFGKEQIQNFLSLSFINREYELEISFKNNELFTETKYKYFFNVVFSIHGGSRWIFGKLFFQKYPVMFYSDLKKFDIFIDRSGDEGNGSKDSKKLSGTAIFLIVLGIIVLLAITGVLFYFLGKNLNKLRKKKANELNDEEYDYTSKADLDNKANQVVN